MSRKSPRSTSAARPRRSHANRKPQRTFTVLIERDEDGWLVASVPALRGCFTQARTLAELDVNIREAIAAYLDASPRGALAISETEFVAVHRLAI